MRPLAVGKLILLLRFLLCISFLKKMKILVTGAAGFIGFHTCARLLASGKAEVLGIDNLNDYYAVSLKKDRIAQLETLDGFRFVQTDFADAKAIPTLFASFKPDYVVHLGAQAGVRYSLQHPEAYTHSNLVGFAQILEAVREHRPKHLVFASSSSVYGEAAQVPFREDAELGRPLSYYAATKQANEAMAYSYARNHNLRITGLRFFTAYGPWGRPDMTPMLFTEAIRAGKTIKLYNEGRYLRDFTYIGDIVDGIAKALLYPPLEAPTPDFRLFNLGNNTPVMMSRFVSVLEEKLGRKALVELLPPQATEMPETCADISAAQNAFGFRPSVQLETGIEKLVAWHLSYYPEV